MRSDKCPVCHGLTIDGLEKVIIGARTARQECSCTSCGTEWIAIYNLQRQVVTCRFGAVAAQERTYPADPYRYALAQVLDEARQALARGKTNGGCLPSAVGTNALRRIEAAVTEVLSPLGEK